MATKPYTYTDEDLSTWERIKKAFANDWEQTKADFGSDTARDMNQDVDDTLKQMAGSENAFENREQAFRFGYTSQRRYGNEYPEWNEYVDARLQAEYGGNYEADRADIRHAYEYRPKS